MAEPADRARPTSRPVSSAPDSEDPLTPRLSELRLSTFESGPFDIVLIIVLLSEYHCIPSSHLSVVIMGVVEDSLFNPNDATHNTFPSWQLEESRSSISAEPPKLTWAERAFSAIGPSQLPSAFQSPERSSQALSPPPLRASLSTSRVFHTAELESDSPKAGRHSTHLPLSPSLYSSQPSLAPLNDTIDRHKLTSSTPAFKKSATSTFFTSGIPDSFSDSSTAPPLTPIKKSTSQRKSKTDISFWSFSGDNTNNSNSNSNKENATNQESPATRPDSSNSTGKGPNSQSRKSGTYIRDRLSGLLRKPSVGKGASGSGTGEDGINYFSSSRMSQRIIPPGIASPTTPVLAEPLAPNSPRISGDGTQVVMTSPALLSTEKLLNTDPSHRSHRELVQDFLQLKEDFKNMAISKRLLDQSVRTFNQELNQIRAAHKGAEERADTLAGQLTLAKEASDDMHNKLVIARGELQQSQQQAQTLRKERRGWAEQAEAAEKEALRLTTELNTAQERVTELESYSSEEAVQLQQTIERQAQTISDQAGSVTRLTNDQEQLTETMNDLMEKLRSVGGGSDQPALPSADARPAPASSLTASTLETIKQDYANEVTRLANDHALLADTMTELTARAKDYKTQIRTLKGERADMEQKITVLTDQVTQLDLVQIGTQAIRDTLAQKEERVSQLEAECARFGPVEAQFRLDITDLEQIKVELQAQVARLEKDRVPVDVIAIVDDPGHDIRLAALQQDYDTLEAEFAEATELVENLRTEAAHHATQRQSLVARVTHLEVELTESRKAQEKLLTEHVTWNEQWDRVKQQATDADEQRVAMEIKCVDMELAAIAAEEARMEAEVQRDALLENADQTGPAPPSHLPTLSRTGSVSASPARTAQAGELVKLKGKMNDFKVRRDRLQNQITSETRAIAEFELEIEVTSIRLVTLRAEQQVLSVQLRDILLENRAIQYEIDHQTGKKDQQIGFLQGSCLEASAILNPAAQDRAIQVSLPASLDETENIKPIQTSAEVVNLSSGINTLRLSHMLVDTGVQTSPLCMPEDAQNPEKALPIPEHLSALSESGRIEPEFSSLFSLADEVMDDRTNLLAQLSELDQERTLLAQQLAVNEDNLIRERQGVEILRNQIEQITENHHQTERLLSTHLAECQLTTEQLEAARSSAEAESAEAQAKVRTLETRVTELEHQATLAQPAPASPLGPGRGGLRRSFTSQRDLVGSTPLTNRSQSGSSSMVVSPQEQRRSSSSLSAVRPRARAGSLSASKSKVEITSRTRSRTDSLSPVGTGPASSSSSSLVSGLRSPNFARPPIPSNSANSAETSDSLRREVNQLQQALDKLESEAVEREKRTIELTEQLRNAQKQLADTQGQLSRYEQEQTARAADVKFRTTLDEAHRDREQKRNQQQLSEFAQLIETQKGEIATLQLRLHSEHSKLVNEKHKDLTTQQRRIDELLNTIHKKDTQISSLRENLLQHHGRIDALEQEYASYRRQQERAEKKLESAHRLSVKLRDAASSSTPASSQPITPSSPRSATPASVALVSSPAELTQQVADLEAKISDLTQRLREEQQHVQRGLYLAEESRGHHLKEVQGYQIQLATFEKDVEDLRDRIQVHEDTINHLRKQVADGEQEREALIKQFPAVPTRHPSELSRPGSMFEDGSRLGMGGALQYPSRGGGQHDAEVRLHTPPTPPPGRVAVAEYADGYTTPGPVDRHVRLSVSSLSHSHVTSPSAVHWSTRTPPRNDITTPIPTPGGYSRRSTDVASLLTDAAHRQPARSPAPDRMSPGVPHNHTSRRQSISSLHSSRAGLDWRSAMTNPANATSFGLTGWNPRLEQSGLNDYLMSIGAPPGTPASRGHHRTPSSGSANTNVTGAKQDVTNLIAQLELKDFELQKTQLFHQEQSKKLIRANSRIEYLELVISNNEKAMEHLQRDLNDKLDTIQQFKRRLDSAAAEGVGASDAPMSTSPASANGLAGNSGKEPVINEEQLADLIARNQATVRGVESLFTHIQSNFGFSAQQLQRMRAASSPPSSVITGTTTQEDNQAMHMMCTDLVSPSANSPTNWNGNTGPVLSLPNAMLKELAAALVRGDHDTVFQELCAYVNDMRRTGEACQTLLQCLLRKCQPEEDDPSSSEAYSSPTFHSVPHLLDNLHTFQKRMDVYRHLVNLVESVEAAVRKYVAGDNGPAGNPGNDNKGLDDEQANALQELEHEVRSLASAHLPHLVMPAPQAHPITSLVAHCHSLRDTVATIHRELPDQQRLLDTIESLRDTLGRNQLECDQLRQQNRLLSVPTHLEAPASSNALAIGTALDRVHSPAISVAAAQRQSDLEAEIDQYRAKITVLAHEKHEALQETTDLRHKCKHWSDQCYQYEKDLRTEQRHGKALAEDLDNTQETLHRLQTQLETKKHDLEAAERFIDQLQHESQLAKADYQELESHISRVSNLDSSTQQSLEALRRENAQLIQDLQHQQQALQEARQSDEGKVKALEKELATLREQLSVQKVISSPTADYSGFDRLLQFERDKHTAELRRSKVKHRDELVQERNRANQQARELEQGIRYWRSLLQREQSFRADLGYQKQYLLMLIGGWEQVKSATLVMITKMGLYSQNPAPRRNPTILKFRKAVVAIIYIKRMSALAAHYRRIQELKLPAAVAAKPSSTTTADAATALVRRGGANGEGGSSGIPLPPLGVVTGGRRVFGNEISSRFGLPSMASQPNLGRRQ
ncbi:A-kinase anchor protein 9 [Dimargaris cristalligena]|uniref:Pericentrin/AKAP-450 centrosomal targeting domain-containing protein n=1 Tax=Dimargaris cristalligena TaxID=215637 RepID=A0A4P9ZWD6_9FUNG|nr:A-kinase anchor protein 9 [Dimargaris cristalligena]RKP37628.1 hypothetical protein BJ085DRAFT_35651 [Dimargaris cristalligena]|eukprot:RKP37628.1 hypothetical protein BJ085DRAFT_35651 [Dimargaris cristalligena]